MKQLLFAILLLSSPIVAHAQEKAFTAEQIEFFERRIRPVFAENCYSCHSSNAKKLKGGLALDSRAGLLEGGGNGPAIVPGDPAKSRLIVAISYQKSDLKMPPKTKLPDAVIADLTAWIKMGAPWPTEKAIAKKSPNDFDLAKRAAEHWCWQAIRVPVVPKVQDAAWPRGDIDRFLLSSLEAKRALPAADADPAKILRRLTFDIVGLPPSRDELETFMKAWGEAGANTQPVLAAAVDRLLASPQFGERWARHWLDLVRYAESRGHEFDYTIPNAYHYRDYVIRAINADVPYNQFVSEHLAGDLLPTPRLNKAGGNESILGSGFWFLGEEIHSPVDIRQDQADRFDNRIDVMTKTFLGMTVACARCHDHKFDAISTKDYYALFGMLQSSNYRLARFDSIANNRRVAKELQALRDESRNSLQMAMAKAMTPTVNKLDAYLLTASGIEDRAKDLNPELLKRWKAALAVALKNDTSPLHPFALAVSQKNKPVQEVLAPLVKRWSNLKNDALEMKNVIVDYTSNGTPTPLLADDATFGVRPLQAGEVVLGTVPTKPISRIVELGAVERDPLLDSLKLSPGAQNESGSLGGMPRPGRTMRTPEFTIKPGKVYAYVKGSGMIYAAVGQHIMLAGPLHGRLVQKFATGDKYQWVAIDLTPYVGQPMHLEFTPNAGSNFALSIVVQADVMPPVSMQAAPIAFAIMHREKSKSIADVSLGAKQTFDDAIFALTARAGRFKLEFDVEVTYAPLTSWMVQNSDLFIVPESDEEKALVKIAAPILEKQQKLLAQLKLDSRLALAMQDGAGIDEQVFIRGNPKMLGPVVPRRFLEATGARTLKNKPGSGRLELAQILTDPAITPFTTRVYVNRVWHHLFGRGIVGTVDNFGVLGEAPTHPELLDYLADRFEKDGWSTKKLIREIVLSRAYQMSTTTNAKFANADVTDPDNKLLHKMRIRRLEGEAIRDTILKVSGRLNPAMFGPSVPVNLTLFQDGRGRPQSGPLDGDGRRSVYLAVRRNFLSAFLLAFDTPSPFSTVGRRTVSNVPAQALILMNDPFVHGQAEVWAKRVLAEKASDEDRVRGMYLDAFSRPAADVELRACLVYLGATPDLRRWSDLAHVLCNTKEFYFVN
ncbi:MAG: DUF1553 domain-containing protein [Gemmataceae bacterium]|nr:DUF1553 domain-containing protein [Gemmataceae bacterium]